MFERPLSTNQLSELAEKSLVEVTSLFNLKNEAYGLIEKMRNQGEATRNEEIQLNVQTQDKNLFELAKQNDLAVLLNVASVTLTKGTHQVEAKLANVGAALCIVAIIASMFTPDKKSGDKEPKAKKKPKQDLSLTPDLSTIEPLPNLEIVSLLANNVSRRDVKKAIDANGVLVNGRLVVSANYSPKSGDQIEITYGGEPILKRIKPEHVELSIVFEDDQVAVINKPKGLVVHPGAGNFSGTLASGLAHHFQSQGNDELTDSSRTGLVQRLDKLTSGLMVVAKTKDALTFLQREMKQRKIVRTYIAVVNGTIVEDKGKIEAPIGRDVTDRRKMRVTTINSRAAITHFQVLKRLPKHTILACQLETGRTHQIRVHMAFIKHPITGDQTYGPKSESLATGQLLHS
ncbi:unnamed protein product [Didymodactylos carnosus]|uniref:Pseudouridine synthase n=1 Tax=Didymodactylos carnosus TaxID=1234261 RepID=A0A8S2H244_9BILA|nr:unnamed protein product [Didymodactylos carnosus]CAF3587357.1 unnamed protein product [Didymodactylos carnosus]